MSLYFNRNGSVFPQTASRNTYGFKVEDWIYLRTNQPTYPIEKSPIVAQLDSSNSNLCHCPADRNDKDRVDINDGNGPYFYTSTLTSYAITGGKNNGMASIHDQNNN